MLKAGRKYGQRQGQETRQNRCFPLRPMAAEAVEEEEISCVSGEGLAFAEASFDLSEFATVRARGCKFKNCSFYRRTSLVKVLIETVLLQAAVLRAVTGRMCWLKRANLRVRF